MQVNYVLVLFRVISKKERKKKKTSALARGNVTGAGIVLEYNRGTTSNRSPAKVLGKQVERSNTYTITKQNVLKSLFLEVRNKINFSISGLICYRV